MQTKSRERLPFVSVALMLLYVPCTALCINPPLVAGRIFLILAAWFVLWMLPFLFFPRKFCYRTAVAVLLPEVSSTLPIGWCSNVR